MAAAAVLLATTATSVALLRDRDDDPAPAATSAPGDLPEGWQPWAAKAKAAEGPTEP
ncbi:hypothetical protein GCM10027074_08600 [Streptomyces deserti]